MTPTQQRTLTNRAVNEALAQLAVAGMEPGEAAYNLAREAALQMVAFSGPRAAAHRLYEIAREVLGPGPAPQEVFPAEWAASRAPTKPGRKTSKIFAPTLVRLLRRVEVEGDTGCWVWGGAKLASGYGSIGVGGEARSTVTHRITYEAARGKIATGLVLDHLCRNRACCNPHHLQAVTDRINMIRGVRWAVVSDTCGKGHAFTPDNTCWSKGDRSCRTCARARAKEHYAARRAAIQMAVTK